MNNRYSLLGQEDPDYYMLQPTTSSPTSSSSSPIVTTMETAPMVTTGMQINSIAPMHWQPIAFPFDQQQHMAWANTHPQQHQHSYFQHHHPQQQLQHHPHYQQQLQQQQQFQQQHQQQLQLQQQQQQQHHQDLWTSQLNMQEQDYYHHEPYPLFPQEQVHYFSPPTAIQPLPPLQPLPTTAVPDTHIPASLAARETRVDMANQTKSSPNVTPIPSPTTSSSKRKRDKGGGGEGTTKRSKGNANETAEEDAEGGVDTRLKGNLKAVDHLERELSYLGGDIATILILLDSLRNAFLADIAPSTGTSSERRAPTLPSISSFDSRISPSQLEVEEEGSRRPTIVQDNTRRPSRMIAQNPEMEREMRTAYDELWHQTRQLEKKVESLEVKSKYANILDMKKQEECNSPTNSDALSSSVLSEEEFDDDYLSK
ncbi:hypothetical protein INT47_003062 [Mucor saturninus]|uniref:Uncharacterized protein n=1 Tax=Mucor saturninus TaxID=64648 RepID=A0A8H7QKU4_9FUNG|nr:hypothetical protein INT47_003062 [Mucor saturninus]